MFKAVAYIYIYICRVPGPLAQAPDCPGDLLKFNVREVGEISEKIPENWPRIIKSQGPGPRAGDPDPLRPLSGG